VSALCSLGRLSGVDGRGARDSHPPPVPEAHPRKRLPLEHERKRASRAAA